jgi:hypothetical protein
VIVVKKIQIFPGSLSKAACSVRILLVIVLLLASATSHVLHASTTSNGITGPANAAFRAGLWWDPAKSGTGWEINQSGDTVFGIWYTYNGDGDPVWYTTHGLLSDGHYQGDLLSYSWDYNNQKVNAHTVAGSVSFDFLNPQLAGIQWRLGEQQGQYTLRPFLFSADPALSDHSGSWFDPQDSGYGMTIQSQGDLTYAVLYYFDKSGNPKWSAGNNAQDSQSLSMLSFKGSCPWCEYAPPEHTPVGELVPEFHSETTLSLEMILPDAAPLWTKSQAQHVMISNPPSGRPHPAAMARISSEDALAYYFKTGYLKGNGHDYSYICPQPIVSPAPPSVIHTSSVAPSSTNVQVEGVDEADVVKATREYLYSLDLPLNKIAFSRDDSVVMQSVTRYRISDDGDIPVGDGSYPISLPRNPEAYNVVSSQGLYHYEPESDSEPASSKLIYLASQVQGGCTVAANASISIRAFDAGADDDFVVDTQLEIDGELIASRQIGDRLFVATTFKPDLLALAKMALDPKVASEFKSTPANIEALFDLLEPDQLFPAISYPDGSHQRLVATENVMMPLLPPYGVEPVITTLSMFDINDLSLPPVSIAVMGRTNGMYATSENVYFASSHTGYDINEIGEIVKTGFSDTDIHKIAILRDSFEYRGSGTVEGSLGNDPERLAFRMSEYQDHLRVVSSEGWQTRWGIFGDHRLTILKESEGNKLLLGTVSVLPNDRRPEPIGKPGETIHGVRFRGERGYVVTFVRVDPLYSLDLSEPTDPRILGELQIEGFSDYLHPVGDNLLIGIGMQAETSPADGNTWIQGVQVGLFDVSAPAAPVLLNLQEIGYRGTTTPVLDTHRAFTSVPGDPATGKPMRFIIPISEHAPPDGIENPEPSHWYPWKTTGILMFEVDESKAGISAFEMAGRADLASTATIEPDDAAFYRNLHEDYSRSVIYGDQVFHYFRGGLFMTNWPGGGFTPADNCPLCVPGD